LNARGRASGSGLEDYWVDDVTIAGGVSVGLRSGLITRYNSPATSMTAATANANMPKTKVVRVIHRI
jgi:hypothetical protein